MRALLITCYLAAGVALIASDRPPIEVDPAQFTKTDGASVPARRLIVSEIADYFPTAETPKGIVVTVLPPEKAPDEEDAEDLARRIVPITLAMRRVNDVQVELHERPAPGVTLRASLVRDALVANGVPADKITIASAPEAGRAPSVDIVLGGERLKPASPAVSAGL